jgi:hypothetical protein
MAISGTQFRGSRRAVVAAALTLATGAFVAPQLHLTAAHADLTPVSAAAAVSPSVIASPAAAAPEGPTAPPAEGPSAAPAPVQHAAQAAPAAVPTPKQKRPARAATATATGQDVCSGPSWTTRRGQQALSTLKDDGSRSGVTVSFLGARSGYLGLTYPSQHHVDVFVRSCAVESAALLRHVVSHEMGHAYDAAHMTPALRAAYMAMRGIPAGTPWFGCSYCTDFHTPAGDFAETYSQWQRGASDSRTTMATIPSATQLAAIAAAFFGA